MDVANAHKAARTAGLVTAPIGLGLLLRPALLARLGISEATARAIGVADLGLAPGLLAGRPRWPFMVARALANVLTAVAAARGGTLAGRLVAAALAVATIVDGRAALSLRGEHRPNEVPR